MPRTASSSANLVLAGIAGGEEGARGFVDALIVVRRVSDVLALLILFRPREKGPKPGSGNGHRPRFVAHGLHRFLRRGP